jgi:hypothetical protein
VSCKTGLGVLETLGFLVGATVERARLESENAHLLDRLETRKVVERAKGILQRDMQLSEEDAYLTLQRESRQRRKSMREVAEAIVLSEDLKKIEIISAPRFLEKNVSGIPRNTNLAVSDLSAGNSTVSVSGPARIRT